MNEPTVLAVDAGEMNAAFEKLAAPTVDAERAMRALAIGRRWPHLAPDVVQFAADNDLSDDEIAGALFMVRSNRERQRAASSASRRWSVPSAGYKRSLKSKRR